LVKAISFNQSLSCALRRLWDKSKATGIVPPMPVLFFGGVYVGFVIMVEFFSFFNIVFYCEW